MDKKNQERIIREMLSGMERRMMDALPKIPEEWDGIELRLLLNEVSKDFFVTPDKKRLKDFKSFCIVNNL